MSACASGGFEGRGILALRGEMDIHTAPEFIDDALVELDRLGSSGSVLVVDVSGLTFMDCSGIGALLAIRRVALARDCRVVVTGATGTVQKLLRLTAVESLFAIQLPTIVIPRDSDENAHLQR